MDYNPRKGRDICNDATMTGFNLLDTWRILLKYLTKITFPYVNLTHASFGNIVLPKGYLPMQVLLRNGWNIYLADDVVQGNYGNPVMSEVIPTAAIMDWTNNEYSSGFRLCTLDFKAMVQRYLDTGEYYYVAVNFGNPTEVVPFCKGCYYMGRVLWQHRATSVPMLFDMSHFRNMPEYPEGEELLENGLINLSSKPLAINGICPLSLYRSYGECFKKNVRIRLPYITQNGSFRTLFIGYTPEDKVMVFLKKGYRVKNGYGYDLKVVDFDSTDIPKYKSLVLMNQYDFRRICTKQIKFSIYNESNPDETYNFFSTEAVGNVLCPFAVIPFRGRTSKVNNKRLYIVFGV